MKELSFISIIMSSSELAAVNDLISFFRYDLDLAKAGLIDLGQGKTRYKKFSSEEIKEMEEQLMIAEKKIGVVLTKFQIN